MFILRSLLPAVEPLLLDSYTLGVAYSLRRLRSDYSGPCIRVRQNGGTGPGTAETDINFVNDVVDSAAVASFLAANGDGEARIAKWYDQGQHAVHIGHTTVGVQPLFVASGINGLPTIRGTAVVSLFSVSGNLDIIATGVLDDDEATFFYVVKPTGSTGQHHSWGFHYIGDVDAAFQNFVYTDNLHYFDWDITSGRLTVAIGGSWYNNPHVYEQFHLSDGTQTIVVDGTQLATDNLPNTLAGTLTSTLELLGTGASGNTTGLVGDMSEAFIIKTGEGSPSRTAIRENLGDYYGITV